MPKYTGTLPKDWKAEWTCDNYYYFTDLGKSSNAMDKHTYSLPTFSHAGLKTDWTALHDKASDCTVYFNQKTHERQFQEPEVPNAPNAPVIPPATAAPGHSSAPVLSSAPTTTTTEPVDLTSPPPSPPRQAANVEQPRKDSSTGSTTTPSARKRSAPLAAPAAKQKSARVSLGATKGILDIPEGYERVEQVLLQLGYEKDLEKFVDNDLSDDLLLEIEKRDLMEAGMTVGRSIKFLKAVRDLGWALFQQTC